MNNNGEQTECFHYFTKQISPIQEICFSEVWYRAGTEKHCKFTKVKNSKVLETKLTAEIKRMPIKIFSTNVTGIKRIVNGHQDIIY